MYLLQDSKRTIALIIVYVDDLLVTTNDPMEFKTLKQRLIENFKIRDLEPPELCVELEVKRLENCLYISQGGYINDLLDKYGLKDCKPDRLPIPGNLKLEQELTGTDKRAQGDRQDKVPPFNRKPTAPVYL